MEVTRQPQGGQWKKKLTVEVECTESLSYQWWMVDTDKGGIVECSDTTQSCSASHSNCFYFCVITSQNYVTCVSDLVENEGEEGAFFPSWPLRRDVPCSIEPTSPSSGYVGRYMAGYKTTFSSVPFFEGFAQPAIADLISDNDLREFHGLMYKGLQSGTDGAKYIRQAFSVLCQLPMLIQKDFLVEDPRVVGDAPFGLRGAYRADMAIIFPLTCMLFYALGIGERKDGKNVSPERALNQVMREYQCLWRYWLRSGQCYAKFAKRTCFPSFVFTIVKKNNFNLYGVATHGQEKISHCLLCSCSRMDDKSKFDELAYRLKSGMLAMVQLLESMKATAEEASSSSLFPVVKPDCYPQLEYVNMINSRVFEAKERKDGPVNCIVKFLSITYPEEVHQHCYENGIAPKFRVEKADGYTIVVMEKVKEAMNLDEYIKAVASHSSSCAPYQLVIESMERALHVLHSKGYVHGDFRGPNILVCYDGSVKIVDFDWSGKKDETKYEQLGNYYVWPCFKSSELRQCHDLYFLAGYKRKIREAAAGL